MILIARIPLQKFGRPILRSSAEPTSYPLSFSVLFPPLFSLFFPFCCVGPRGPSSIEAHLLPRNEEWHPILDTYTRATRSCATCYPQRRQFSSIFFIFLYYLFFSIIYFSLIFFFLVCKLASFSFFFLFLFLFLFFFFFCPHARLPRSPHLIYIHLSLNLPRCCSSGRT